MVKVASKKPNITSKTGRAALKVRREPYWSRVRTGLYIGYRRLSEGEGTWIARYQGPGGAKQYRSFGSIGDDKAYDSAVKEAGKWADGLEHGVENKTITIEQACKTYVEDRRLHKSPATAADAEGRFTRLVYGKKIGNASLEKLNPSTLKAWLNGQLNHRDGEDALRRSKDTANRTLSCLKAALNLALKDRLVTSDLGWKSVAKFSGVGRRRTDVLTLEQRHALLDACPEDLRVLVKSLLLTGARVGEIADARVRDLDKAQGLLELTGKTGSRVCPLSTEALKLFVEQAKDKTPAAPLLAKADGSAWNKVAWTRAFRKAAQTAGLPRTVVVYSLRHAAISEMIANGVDSFIVAKLSGTSSAMIDKFYGQLRHVKVRERLDTVKII